MTDMISRGDRTDRTNWTEAGETVQTGLIGHKEETVQAGQMTEGKDRTDRKDRIAMQD